MGQAVIPWKLRVCCPECLRPHRPCYVLFTRRLEEEVVLLHRITAAHLNQGTEAIFPGGVDFFLPRLFLFLLISVAVVRDAEALCGSCATVRVALVPC